MAPLRWSALLVGAAAFLLGSRSDPSSHSMRFFRTGVSEPSQGLPAYTVVGYLDDQPFLYYDQHTRMDRPKCSWIRKVEKDVPDYWERNTQISWNTEEVFKVRLVNVPKYYNQSGGLHTWQEMYGCELRGDGSTVALDKYAYDGRTYLSFDKETLTWTAADAAAQVTKRKLESEPAIAQRNKAYLEGFCVEMLRRLMGYAEEALQRRESPVVKVTRRKGFDGAETLTCWAFGFYPKEIDLVWTKDGEVWLQDTFRGVVAPNADGTYHAWASVRVDPQDRDRYHCRVGHDSLPHPLGFAWEDDASNVWLVTFCVVGGGLLVLLLGAVAAGLCWYGTRQADPGGASRSKVAI